MNETTKSTAAKDNATGSSSPATREVPTVVAESLVSPLNAFKRPVTPAKSTCHKKKETAGDCKVREVAEAISNSSKTKVPKVLSEAGEGL